MTEITPEQKKAIDDLSNAVAAVLKYSSREIQTMAEHVAVNGTDHDGGSLIDTAVTDILDVLSDL